jgi:SNF family Na+-dependent transporter
MKLRTRLFSLTSLFILLVFLFPPRKYSSELHEGFSFIFSEDISGINTELLALELLSIFFLSSLGYLLLREKDKSD